MKLYTLTFPMTDGPPRSTIMDAAQLTAFCEAWSINVERGTAREGLGIDVRTIEGDGPLDFEEAAGLLRR